MRFAFSDEQEELRATARAFLAEHSSPERVRAAMESDAGYDAGTWKRIGAELGWTAVAIPEAYGGLGLGAVELVALLEPMGEALLCAPFFATVCLGAQRRARGRERGAAGRSSCRRSPRAGRSRRSPGPARGVASGRRRSTPSRAESALRAATSSSTGA